MPENSRFPTSSDQQKWRPGTITSGFSLPACHFQLLTSSFSLLAFHFWLSPLNCSALCLKRRTASIPGLDQRNSLSCKIADDIYILIKRTSVNICCWPFKPVSSASLSLFLCPVALSMPAPSLPLLSPLSPSILFLAPLGRSCQMRSWPPGLLPCH